MLPSFFFGVLQDFVVSNLFLVCQRKLFKIVAVGYIFRVVFFPICLIDGPTCHFCWGFFISSVQVGLMNTEDDEELTKLLRLLSGTGNCTKLLECNIIGEMLYYEDTMR